MSTSFIQIYAQEGPVVLWLYYSLTIETFCTAFVVMHLRYADLKQVVLDKLLAEHCNAKLDTELHEAACMGTLQEGREGKSQNSKSFVI